MDSEISWGKITKSRGGLLLHAGVDEQRCLTADAGAELDVVALTAPCGCTDENARAVRVN